MNFSSTTATRLGERVALAFPSFPSCTGRHEGAFFHPSDRIWNGANPEMLAGLLAPTSHAAPLQPEGLPRTNPRWVEQARPSGTLVVYSGPTDDRDSLYDNNFQFFLRHGLPCSYHKGQLGRVQVAIVLTNATIAKYESDISRYNQTCGDLLLVERADRCYDMQSALNVLDGVPPTGEPSALAASYEHIVYLNCGVLGPLLSLSRPAAEPYWANRFVEMLSVDADPPTKLSGLAINCGGKLGYSQAHVQSMLWATDGEGLRSILRSGAIFDCGRMLTGDDGRDQLIIRYELGLSKAILGDGFAIKALHGGISEQQRYVWENATSASPSFPGGCHDIWQDRPDRLSGAAGATGTFEDLVKHMLFWKVTRWSPPELQRYAERMDAIPAGVAELRRTLEKPRLQRRWSTERFGDNAEIVQRVGHGVE